MTVLHWTSRSWPSAAVLVATLVSAASGQDSTQQARHGEAVRAATEAAEAWLPLLDRAEYAESWEAAAAAFRQAVSQSYWESQVAQVRAPFVPFGERTLVRSQYVDSLPHAPPGPYVILEYRTRVRG